ncbi:hypothetical protein A6V39_00505 [Candidatus Mycoplasma haematobovis]|uniref:Uncharacterized protein n=1 Tax=Candidatus Mycoplasma haematobovis TaxID=432608 RepID=A0A1A9QEU4_9MOLU|nr:hypothetical protein [Candidatus Mycoplasma haematobovis]OAL10531.1 hypothetical protein A6V39_00505 [Candidatus Mycoplasma haematobovis]
MTPKSILLTVLGVSTVGGVATGGYFFMTPSNLGELLKSEKINLLDPNKDEEKWNKLASKHTTGEITITLENDQIEKIKTIEGLGDISTQTEIKVKSLKDKCKELLNKSITKGDKFEADKQAAIDWCSADSKIFKEKVPIASSSHASSPTNVDGGRGAGQVIPSSSGHSG